MKMSIALHWHSLGNYNCYKKYIYLLTVNGMQKHIKSRSANERFKINKFVVFLICWLNKTVIITKRFPINPVIPINEKNIGTIIDTINSSRSFASNSSGLGCDGDIKSSGNCNSLIMFTPSTLPFHRHQIPFTICFYSYIHKGYVCISL